MTILIDANYNSKKFMINNSIINHNTEMIEEEKLRIKPSDDFIEAVRVDIVNRLVENEKIRRAYLFDLMKEQTDKEIIDLITHVLQESIFNELRYLNTL